MTHRAMQILSFSLASSICAPFVLLLALFALFAAFPGLRGPSLMADLAFLGFYVVSGPVGLASVAVAATAVWFSFRTRQGSRSQFYVLLFYSAVLAGYVVYLAWWYGTGQRLDTP